MRSVPRWSSAQTARHDKAALIYGLMLYDDRHAVESEHALRAAQIGARPPAS
jgi:hypothetical protein